MWLFWGRHANVTRRGCVGQIGELIGVHVKNRQKADTDHCDSPACQSNGRQKAFPALLRAQSTIKRRLEYAES